MRLLHIIGSMNPKSGGTSEAVRNFYAALKKVGIFCEVVSLDAPTEPFLIKEAFPITALGPSKTGWQYSKLLKPWLRKNINQFDVVIVHGLWLYPGYAIRTILREIREKKNNAKRLKEPKVFIMPHGMLDPYFQKAGSRKLKAIRNRIYWTIIESNNVENAEGLLFTCEEELLLARTTFSTYLPKKEINIGMGIIAPPFYTDIMRNCFLEKCPKIKNNNYLLFLSRINEKKGADLLIQAYINIYFKKAKVQVDSVDNIKPPYLVIAGPGLETLYGKKIIEFALASEASEYIFFPGMIESDTKWGALYGCEGFVLTSHQENFGIAVVEALACGKPVLISNKVNIWREIVATEAGIVNEDNQSGAECLLECWQQLSRNEKQIMGQKAKECYDYNFSKNESVRKLLELF